MAAVARRAELAGGRHRLPPAGPAPVRAVHAAEDRRGAASMPTRCRALPETIDEVAPLPVPEACPVTLDELLATEE